MRDIPPALAARLRGGATTLCRCWRVVRRDGIVLGFTDHDRDLAFLDTRFEARSGLEAAEATAELGFAVGGGDVSGALTGSGITERDIAAGRYDDALVQAWLVDWGDAQVRLLLEEWSIGEIRLADGVFVAELRAATHRFDEPRGLSYRRACSADLGDERCRVDLSGPPFAREAVVLATDGATSLTAAALADAEAGWFTGGRLTWTSGAQAGLAVEVQAHRRLPGAGALDLWRRTSHPIRPGDAFRVTAGCDKSLATCGRTFSNVANHRGFPHLPGNDFVLKTARQGEPGLDGGSLFR
jgi:uncharacterized phage protein (TIGR02218 family)